MLKIFINKIFSNFVNKYLEIVLFSIKWTFTDLYFCFISISNQKVMIKTTQPWEPHAQEFQLLLLLFLLWSQWKISESWKNFPFSFLKHLETISFEIWWYFTENYWTLTYLQILLIHCLLLMILDAWNISWE